MTPTTRSLICDAGHCSAQWLAAVLRPRLFGGGYAIMFDSRTREAHPLRVDARGVVRAGEVN